MNPLLTQNPTLCKSIVRLKSGGHDKEDFQLFEKALRDLSAKKDEAAITGTGDTVRGVAQGVREVLSLIDDVEDALAYAQEHKDDQ